MEPAQSIQRTKTVDAETLEAEALEAAAEAAAGVRSSRDNWLERMLLAERRAVAAELERRHRLLVAEVDQRFPEQAGAMEPCSSMRANLPSSSALVDPDAPGGVPKSPSGLSSSPGGQRLPGKRADVPGRAPARRSMASLGEADVPKRSALRSMLEFVVTSHQFEMFFGMLIVLNTLVMCMQAQYEGVHVDFVLKYSSENPESAEEVWPGLAEGFIAIGWVFGIAFTAELVLKVVALGRHFWWSCWNLVDFFVVLFWLIDKGLAETQIFTIDPMLIRFCRLARLLRLVKALRFIQMFDSLQVLVASIKGSMSVLLWSSLLLFAIMMVCAMVLGHFLHEYMLDEEKPNNVRRDLYKYFGSFSRGMVTMLEITLGNWVPVCRLLMENLMEWYGFIIVVYKIIVGFGIMKVITGCFLHETFKVAATDDEIMIMRKQREQDSHHGKMERLFAAADDQGNGSLTRREFAEVLSEPHVKTWLSAMEISFEDANMLFELIAATQKDEGPQEPRISVSDFLQGTTRLRGSAKSLDMWQVLTQTEKIIVDIRHLSEAMSDGQHALAPCDKFPREVRGVSEIMYDGQHAFAPCDQFPREARASPPEAPGEDMSVAGV